MCFDANSASHLNTFTCLKKSHHFSATGDLFRTKSNKKQFKAKNCNAFEQIDHLHGVTLKK